MKICFLTHNVFTVGGIQRVVSVLANELVKTHNVEILCVEDNIKIDRNLYSLDDAINIKMVSDLYKKNIGNKILSKLGIYINNITGIFNNKILNNISKEIYFPKCIRKNFINFFNEQDYDIIIAAEGIYSLLLSIISNEIRSKTIGWQHNSYDAYFNNYKKYCWKLDELAKAYIPQLDKYVVLTDSDKNMFKENMSIDVERIYNPLSFESDKKSKCDAKNILFIGRLSLEQKGIDLLLNAFKIVSEQNSEWILTIVGDGNDRELLIKYINNLGIADRVYLEPATNEVLKYYLNSSIFVSSSRWEGFGLVVIEAMECGLAVVAFDNSGPREIINKNNINGILVSKGNVNLLAESILNLIENKEKLLQISNNAIERSKDFNIKNITKQWENIFINII